MNRKTWYAIAILGIATVMVPPVPVAVNQATNVVTGTLMAVGSPLPAPVPRVNTPDSVLVAVGSPLPAPVPRVSTPDSALVAVGSPLPAPVPHFVIA